MPYFTYDTSVIVARKPPVLQDVPRNFLMSAVVLMELAASAQDLSQRKKFEHAYLHYQRNDLLIVPNADDWLLASKVLFLLTHVRKRLHKGKLNNSRLAPHSV